MREMRWIPVTERKPFAEYGDSDSVLCSCASGLLKILYWDGGAWCYPTGEIYVIRDSSDSPWYCDVLAWQPLPKPYEAPKGE